MRSKLAQRSSVHSTSSVAKEGTDTYRIGILIVPPRSLGRKGPSAGPVTALGQALAWALGPRPWNPGPRGSPQDPNLLHTLLAERAGIPLAGFWAEGLYPPYPGPPPGPRPRASGPWPARAIYGPISAHFGNSPEIGTFLSRRIRQDSSNPDFGILRNVVSEILDSGDSSGRK